MVSGKARGENSKLVGDGWHAWYQLRLHPAGGSCRRVSSRDNTPGDYFSGSGEDGFERDKNLKFNFFGSI